MLKSNKKKRLTGLDGSRMETMRMGSSRSKWLECIFASFFRAHAETESEEEEEEEVGWAVACVTQRCFEESFRNMLPLLYYFSWPFFSLTTSCFRFT